MDNNIKLINRLIKIEVFIVYYILLLVFINKYVSCKVTCFDKLKQNLFKYYSVKNKVNI